MTEDIADRLEANADDYTGELQCEGAAEIRLLRSYLRIAQQALTDIAEKSIGGPPTWPAYCAKLALNQLPAADPPMTELTKERWQDQIDKEPEIPISIGFPSSNPAPIVTGILADRDADFWMDRIEREPDVPIGAGVPDQGDKDKESCRSIAAPIDYGPACPYVPETALRHCRSGRDGECNWDECPQKANYQSYCPYAKAWEDYWEQFE